MQDSDLPERAAQRPEDQRGASAKLWLDVMGQTCGRKPAANFASESFCSRALAWNAKTRTLDFAPVSTVRMIE